jgi:hypothetical protein
MSYVRILIGMPYIYHSTLCNASLTSNSNKSADLANITKYQSVYTMLTGLGKKCFVFDKDYRL